ncbi:MAG: hypothetical protein M3R15_09835 [Acidobacteriota bacterium]|nr:hypothetical protein [Acidobacteriota bacterium]
MDASTLIQLATLISVVVGVIGLLISVRAYKRQVSAQFLLEYSRRVDAITQSLPLSVWGAHLFPEEELSEPSDEVRLGVLRCLNYVSQLYDFCHQGYIPKSVWRKHEGLYAQILRSPLFRREWKTLAPMFATEREFYKYVEGVHQASDEEVGSENAPLNSGIQRTRKIAGLLSSKVRARR